MAGDKKTVVKPFRMTEKEVEKLRLDAEQKGIKESEYIRLLLSQKPNNYPEIRIMAEELDFLTKKIEQYERDLEQSKLEYEKPFAQEAELSEKIARLNELNVQLDLENGRAEDVDLAGQEKEEQSRVAEGDSYRTRPPGKEGR